MQGLLIKTKLGWRVCTTLENDVWSNDIPLHPDDVKKLKDNNKIGDIILIDFYTADVKRVVYGTRRYAKMIDVLSKPTESDKYENSKKGKSVITDGGGFLA